MGKVFAPMVRRRTPTWPTKWAGYFDCTQWGSGYIRRSQSPGAVRLQGDTLLDIRTGEVYQQTCQEKIMSAYHNSNLLYRPSVSVWTARKKDKAESKKVNSDAGAVEGAANVHKQLLPDSPELEAIQKFQSAFRTYVYDNTLPWDDSGWRIGRVVRHMEFMQEVGDKMREFDVLVDEFVDSYAQSIEAAKFTLNALFDPADYPGTNEVRSKFAISVDVMTLPNSEDFRVVDGVPQDEVDKLCDIARNSVEAKIAAGMQEAYKRLFSVVSKMATTLTQYGGKEIKKFNDTLVNNISDLVDIMPALNLTDDPVLAALTSEAKNLVDYDLGDLRKDDRTRKAAIEDAQALAAKFAQLLGGGTEGTPLPGVPKTAAGSATPASLFADMLNDE